MSETPPEGLPDRRRHGYKELEERLDAHAAEIAHRFKKRYRGMLIAFSIIGLSSAVALVGFGIVLEQQGNQQDRIEQLAEENQTLALDIQSQRAKSVRLACEDQNDRNTQTSDALIAAAEEDAAQRETEAEKAEVRRRRDVTLALINALQPVKDCQEVVAIALGEESP